MREVATKRGVSVAQIALAWLLHQPAVTSVIIGAKKPEQLADNIGATRVELSADELARLGAVSALPSEYPGWMFTRQGEVRRKQLADAERRGRAAERYCGVRRSPRRCRASGRSPRRPRALRCTTLPPRSRAHSLPSSARQSPVPRKPVLVSTKK